jgi:hypothetical protein
VDAVLTTSAAGGRGVAPEVAAGVDLTARSGVRLLHPCLRPIRDRDDLGHHTAKASTAWAVLHVLRLRAIGSAGQVASVAGTARVLLFAATAGHAGVPDSRLIAPAAPDGLQGHGAVCGHGRPGSTEVFSPGFAVQGRAGEASLQVSAASRPSVECLLGGACSEGPRWKSLTTRCRPGQRRRSQPSTGTDSWRENLTLLPVDAHRLPLPFGPWRTPAAGDRLPRIPKVSKTAARPGEASTGRPEAPS